MKHLSGWARLYVITTVVVGAALIAYAIPQWRTAQTLRFFLYLTGALLSSSLRVNLPGITGTMSVNFVFTLIGTMDLCMPQVICLSLTSVIGRFLTRKKGWPPVQTAFNTAAIAIAASCSYLVYYSPWLRAVNHSVPMLLFFSSATLFAINTLSVAGIIAFTEKKSVWGVWHENFAWTASHYLVGAGVAAVFDLENRFLGWEAAVLTVPVIYLVYRSYALHLERLREAKEHVTELGDLHWRAIEALALAIDAKDETTHNHLLRVKVYATEIAKELNLSDEQMQAVQAAALLHDIGKLAVPEHIISKPGKLTPEEFEKMKVHPVVGAEILERVRFPYPVAPIVRSHHEKWNGKGYPAGLKGEEIPIGARILSAVDCLDALASDRQYRRALPLDQAMAIVTSESGISYDPKIVEILQRRYVELERMATSLPVSTEAKLSKNVKFSLGEGPATGFEKSERTAVPVDEGDPIDFMISIAAARHDFQDLLNLADELGGSLSVDETLSLLAVRLKRMIPHDTISVYVLDKDKLIPKYVNGESSRLFSGLEIPVGMGLSGWVVENRKPIVNGNPSVEHGFLNDPAKTTHLRSALSVPLEAKDQVVGVLTLYSETQDYFTKEHLRILMSICSRAGMTLANAIQNQRVAACAVTDELTGLPNARSLFVHLESQLKIAAERNIPVTVLLIDLDEFKQVNDRFGHLKGNRVLQEVANGLRRNCREHDYVARMGGDEFVVVMPRMSPEALVSRIEQFSLVANAGECPGFLGLSVGAAIYPQDGSDAETLLAFADLMMYRVKQEHHRSKEMFARSGANLALVH